LASVLTSEAALAQRFSQVNLVSDVSGLALNTDANLRNPWGLVPSSSGVFWASNNGSSTSTLYNPDGSARPLIVTIPGGAPTGVVFASPTDSSFRIVSGDSTARAGFIFVTQLGTVAAWNPNVDMTHAIQVASTDGAVYTGAAIAGAADTPHLYAANFAQARIDVFDRDFHLVSLSGNFTDPNLPTDYAPFNIANVGGQLYVAYAQVDPNTHEEMAGPGLGFVSEFNTDGTFVRRFTSNGELNAPWAIVQAPAGFGPFGGSVLVGNFGNGWINAFDPASGSFQGSLQDTLGNPLAISGLWGLHFGAPASGTEVAQRLYFNAGIEDEAHGLFGYLSAFTEGGGPGPGPTCDNDSKGLGFWKHQCPNDHGHGNGHGHGHGDGEGGDDQGEDEGGGGGHGHGHGLIFGHGLGFADGDHGDGEHDGDGHGNGHGLPADSLESLFACVTSASAPNAFGEGGCFTAGCELLRKTAHRTDRERAAQQLLVTRLNLCAGLVCDSLHIVCSEHEGDGEDEDDDKGALPVLTVGEVADSLDALLCEDGHSSTIRSLGKLLACVNDSDDEDDDDGGEHDGDHSLIARKIEVRRLGVHPTPLSLVPVQFAVTVSEPVMARLRIYDAMGRLVAEPMQNSFVIGTKSVNWDGRNLHGDLVAPGNYFYRATAGSDWSSGRIVIIR